VWRISAEQLFDTVNGELVSSNGNASVTKANGVFFDIEAKQTPSTVSKLFSFDRIKIIFEAKRTRPTVTQGVAI
jgi:hypothetical protein